MSAPPLPANALTGGHPEQAAATRAAIPGPATGPRRQGPEIDLPDLPALREDLILASSAQEPDGSPTWVIQDPVRNKFFKIGWLEFEMLSRWQASPLELMRDLVTTTDLRPELEDLLGFARFLSREGLTHWGSARDLEAARRAPGKPGLTSWHWWLHNYLFFRIPLTRPDRMLSRALPAVQWIFSRWTLMLVLAMSMTGLVLVFRQWEVFSQTFVDSLTVSGLISFGMALMLAKGLHELGHAMTATRYGIKVAHMGLAFLVLWPMLYTDTGESWRLRDSRQRLRIAIAGIAVEASIAGLSLFAWALAPPGALKSAFFYLATTSLAMTLLLNMSPFMRFDGYFVLSDALSLPNLHERSGALARTALRRVFLGWQEPWAEHFPHRMRQALIAFALGTWVYRFFLFLGIAAAVYFMFFKALGILLFAVEIIWFILRPIYRELKVWGMRRRETQMGRASAWLLLALVAGLWLAWPRAHLVHAPAQLQARHQTIYSPLSAQVVQLTAGGLVRPGDALIVLTSPKLQNDAFRARINAEAARAALLSAELGEQDRADQIGKLGQNLAQFTAEDRAAGSELERLKLVAAFAGRWTDLESTLAAGTWVRPQDVLGTLVDESRWEVEAWVEEAEVQELKAGAAGKFYPANRVEPPLAVRLIEIDAVRASALPHPGLSTEHGGPIPTVNEGRTLVPRASLYRVKLELAGLPGQKRWTRGRIAIEGESYSLLWHGLRYAAAVLIRESSF